MTPAILTNPKAVDVVAAPTLRLLKMTAGNTYMRHNGFGRTIMNDQILLLEAFLKGKNWH